MMNLKDIKEAVITYLQVPSLYLYIGYEENHETN